VAYVQETGIAQIREKEESLTRRLLEGLQAIDGVTEHGPREPERRLPVLSFNIAGIRPSDVGHALDRESGVMARVGLHCAPAAHETLGTSPGGTVRLSLSCLNTEDQVDRCLEALAALAGRR
jgi:selenocysteine lyase/cysteine desulfurase